MKEIVDLTKKNEITIDLLNRFLKQSHGAIFVTLDGDDAREIFKLAKIGLAQQQAEDED